MTAVRLVEPEGAAGFVIICDHASNHVPPELADLGLPAAELARHIAWDIGAAGVAEQVARQLAAPALLCGTSRLVVDCNRRPEDPAAMPETSDGTAIPGNRQLTAAARAERIARFFRPYHAAVEAAIERKLAVGQRPVLLSLHSMTPALAGRTRPWQIALSSHRDRRLTEPVLARLRAVPGIVVGDNEPYDLDPAEDFSVPHHAFARGLLSLQVEFRQDEVATPAGQARWAALFTAALEQALAALPSPA